MDNQQPGKQQSICTGKMGGVDNMSDTGIEEMEDDFLVVENDMFTIWVRLNFAFFLQPSPRWILFLLCSLISLTGQPIGWGSNQVHSTDFVSICNVHG